MKPFGSHAHCVGRDMPPPATVPSLDYNVGEYFLEWLYMLIAPFLQVYAAIVGDCAWAAGGCPITPQNFVDLIYSSVQTNWPS